MPQSLLRTVITLRLVHDEQRLIDWVKTSTSRCKDECAFNSRVKGCECLS